MFPGNRDRRLWRTSPPAMDRLVQLVFLPGYPAAIGLMYLLVRDYVAAAFLVSALSFSGAGLPAVQAVPPRLRARDGAACDRISLCSARLFLLRCAHEREPVSPLQRPAAYTSCGAGNTVLAVCWAPMRHSRARWASCFSSCVFELVNAYLRGGKRRGTLARFFGCCSSPQVLARTAI